MLKIDLHIHTIASGHAFSTISDIAKSASEKKMMVIGIADHGPTDGYTNKHYFSVLATRVPNKIQDIRILKGVEANISNDGELDIEERNLSRLDYVIAGIHQDPYIDEGKIKNTKNLLKAMENKHVKIISHPYFYKDCRIDMEKVANKACKKNILLEVNISVFNFSKFLEDPEHEKDLRKMIEIVKKHNKKVIVNSDAHSEWEVGDDSILTPKLKKKIGLTDDMIINNYPKELEKFLGVKF